MRKIKVAAIQMCMSDIVKENILHAEELVRRAANDGANMILLPELNQHFLLVSFFILIFTNSLLMLKIIQLSIVFKR